MARDEKLRQREANEFSMNTCSATNRHVPHIDARFGARMRDLRKERQWTQLYMAVHFGIDRIPLSDVERGFGVSVSKLLVWL